MIQYYIKICLWPLYEFLINFIGTKALISTAHHCCVAIKESLSRKAEIPFAAAYHTKMSTLKSLESDVSQLNIELDRSIFHQNQVGAARLMSKKASTDYSFNYQTGVYQTIMSTAWRE